MANELLIEDGEDADVVICVRLTRPLLFPDNLIDLCSRCGGAIQHRPHVPKRPKKVCEVCIKPELEKAYQAGEVNMIVSPETVAEVLTHKRKRKAH